MKDLIEMIDIIYDTRKPEKMIEELKKDYKNKYDKEFIGERDVSNL